MQVGKQSVNSDEAASQIRLKDVLEKMEHNRDLIIGVIFKENTGAQVKLLEPEFNTNQIKEMKQKEQTDMISLDSCFNAFSREEVLSGNDQWYCNKCKEQRDINKKLELYRLPKILIIQLKRFQSQKSNSKSSNFMSLAYAQVLQEKVGDHVDFPTTGLDLRKFVQDERIKNSETPVLYDLYAVSNHYGSLNGGHYTAYGYNSHMGRWYNFNDSSVSNADASDVVTSGAYILFYRRRD